MKQFYVQRYIQTDVHILSCLFLILVFTIASLYFMRESATGTTFPLGSFGEKYLWVKVCPRHMLADSQAQETTLTTGVRGDRNRVVGHNQPSDIPGCVRQEGTIYSFRPKTTIFAVHGEPGTERA